MAQVNQFSFVFIICITAALEIELKHTLTIKRILPIAWILLINTCLYIAT